MNVLLASAFEPELVALELPFERVTPVGSRQVLACTLGVGPLAAAASTATRLAKSPVALVLFVGTAGVYPHATRRFRVGSGNAARVTTFVDVSILRRQAECPSVQITSFELAPIWDDAAARVATTPAITIDDGVALELADGGFDLENLELAGVAAACRAAQVPCAAMLGISNVVGSRGREEWRANHVLAARAACDRVAAWLRQPG